MRLGSGRLAALPILLGVSAVLVAGCGSSGSSSSNTSAANSGAAAPSVIAGTKPVPSIVAEVPAAIKAKGTLTVAADASYAPNEFIAPDGHTVIGMDADLATVLAKAMGLKVKIVNAPFATILAGLSAGKYDISLSSFTDTKARQKQVDFVTYFQAGTAFFTKAQGGTSVNTLADLCGHTVSVESGTTEETDAKGQSAKCTKAGKPAVTVQSYPTQTAANLALSSGRAQLSMADSPVAEYQVQKANGQFKLVGQQYGTAPYGIAIPKKSGMTKPVLDALKALIEFHVYQPILAKWGQTSGAITTPVINGATS